MKHMPVTLGIKKMTISTNIAHHTQQAEKELPNTFKEFANIFQQKDTNRLSPSQPFNHAIQLEDSFTSQQAKSYPLNPAKLKVCKAFINKHFTSGHIVPS